MPTPRCPCAAPQARQAATWPGARRARACEPRGAALTQLRTAPPRRTVVSRRAFSAHDTVVPARGKALVKTDLSIAIPEGTYARIAPRSGLAWKNFIDTGAGVRAPLPRRARATLQLSRAPRRESLCVAARCAARALFSPPARSGAPIPSLLRKPDCGDAAAAPRIQVVDFDYRGAVGVILFNHGEADFAVAKGDRVAQLILERIMTPDVVEVDDLDDTARGAGGFGSTGVAAK